MSNPKYSFVIPTRERLYTLKHTLATCLAQEGDFEVVVSDNASSPPTRAFIEQCGDSRVRYVRTPSLLAMTDSLEFAISHARGEYVIIQGDDDGLLLHALRVINQILESTKTPVLRWENTVYNWPDVNNPYFEPDGLLIPLAQTQRGHALRVCPSRHVIKCAANGELSYSDLPVIYNAVIRRDLFDQLRKRTGRVFKTRTPDVYAAFAVAALVDEYHSLNAPLGICGRSGASTGVARHFCKPGSPIDTEFRRLNDEAGLKLHPWVPDLPPIPSAVADAFLWAKTELFPADPEIELNRQQMIRNCLRELKIETDDEWNCVRDTCRQSLADSPELRKWFDEEIATLNYRELGHHARCYRWRRYGSGHLHINAAEFGVADVDSVAELCERLLGYLRDGLPFYVEQFDTSGAAFSELQEKEACIQRLHKACVSLQEQLREQDAHRQAALADQEVRLTAHIRELEAALNRRDELPRRPPANPLRRLARFLLQR